jgi:hypothetical protein
LSPTRQEMIRLLNEVEKLNKGDASKNKCGSYFPVSSPLHITLITCIAHAAEKVAARLPGIHPHAAALTEILHHPPKATPTCCCPRGRADCLLPSLAGPQSTRKRLATWCPFSSLGPRERRWSRRTGGIYQRKCSTISRAGSATMKSTKKVRLRSRGRNVPPWPCCRHFLSSPSASLHATPFPINGQKKALPRMRSCTSRVCSHNHAVILLPRVAGTGNAVKFLPCHADIIGKIFLNGAIFSPLQHPPHIN